MAEQEQLPPQALENLGAAAANTHYMKTYTNLRQLGLYNETASMEDLLNAGLSNMPCLISIFVSSGSAFGADCPSYYGILEIEILSSDRISMRFWKKSSTVNESQDAALYFNFVFVVDGEFLQSGWEEVALNGAKHSNDLWFWGKYGRIYTNVNTAQFESWNVAANSTNRRVLELRNSTGQTNVKRALTLNDRIDDTDTGYLIYGSHNITKGTSDLTAGSSSLDTDCIYLVYE